MPGSRSHPWWKRPTVRWAAAAVVALRLTAILLFRSRRPAFLDAVRRFNKRVLNPLMLHLAGRRHWYAARLEHVGRRTGRPHTTPVVARPVHGGFAIPLPYGPDVDWRRNLQATGSGVLQVDGMRHTIRAPRIVTVDDLPDLPRSWRAVSRVYAIRQWLVVTAPAEQPAGTGRRPSRPYPQPRERRHFLGGMRSSPTAAGDARYGRGRAGSGARCPATTSPKRGPISKAEVRGSAAVIRQARSEGRGAG